MPPNASLTQYPFLTGWVRKIWFRPNSDPQGSKIKGSILNLTCTYDQAPFQDQMHKSRKIRNAEVPYSDSRLVRDPCSTGSMVCNLSNLRKSRGFQETVSVSSVAPKSCIIGYPNAIRLQLGRDVGVITCTTFNAIFKAVDKDAHHVIGDVVDAARQSKVGIAILGPVLGWQVVAIVCGSHARIRQRRTGCWSRRCSSC